MNGIDFGVNGKNQVIFFVQNVNRSWNKSLFLLPLFWICDIIESKARLCHISERVNG